MLASDLEKLFYYEIPISEKMGVKILTADPNKVTIHVPLQANKNHKGTAFGGSQYSCCALACYGLFLIGVRELGYQTNNIVIANGNIKYKAPVKTDFLITANWNDDSKNDFFKKLNLNKKAKVNIQALITSENLICSEFNGDFVAIL
ncbi:MAG: YiiD C-terminal domain-containing protein [Bdellovibrionales bacterium]|nr:YiiD C-terminal domain-containing protein [Bdellovibrionales bacterium]